MKRKNKQLFNNRGKTVQLISRLSKIQNSKIFETFVVTLRKYNQQHISLPWHKPPSVRSFILLHLQGPPSDQPFILSHLQVFHQTKVSAFPNTSRAPPDQLFIPLHFQGTLQTKVSFTYTPRVPLSLFFYLQTLPGPPTGHAFIPYHFWGFNVAGLMLTSFSSSCDFCFDNSKIDFWYFRTVSRFCLNSRHLNSWLFLFYFFSTVIPNLDSFW